MHHLISWVALFGMLSLHPIVAYADQCLFTISGHVIDEHDGQPLSLAVIYIQELDVSVLSDSQGFYEFTGLCQGTYTLSCTHFYCDTLFATVVINKKHAVQNFYPEHHKEELRKLVIHGHDDDVIPVSRLGHEELRLLPAASLGESIRQLPDVAVLQTGQRIAKPMIGGLYGSRIIIVQNDLRQAGQAWGQEHDPDIDASSQGRIEVIRGPGALRYGSEVAGGVIRTMPRAWLHDTGITTSLALSGESNGWDRRVASFTDGRLASLQALKFQVSGSAGLGGNVRTPAYHLGNTGFRQAAIQLGAGLDLHDWEVEVWFSRLLRRLGLLEAAHIGNLTDLSAAIQRGQPLDNPGFTTNLSPPFQHIIHQIAQAKISRQLDRFGQLQLHIARQQNLRDEYDDHDGEEAPALRLHTVAYHGTASWQRTWSEHVESEMAFEHTQEIHDWEGSYLIPGYIRNKSAIFALAKVERGLWRSELSARYDDIRLQALIPGEGVITRKFQRPSAALAIRLDLGLWKMSGMLTTGWRAPDISELFADGVHHGSAAYEVGDSRLNPEVSTGVAWLHDLHFGQFHIAAEGYATRFENFIYLAPQQRAVLTIRGAFPLYHYVQTSALQLGSRFRGVWKIAPAWTLESSLDYAQITDGDGKHLTGIPPARMGFAFEWKDPDHRLQGLYVRPSLEWVGKAKTDFPDFSSPPANYALVHLRIGARWPHFLGQTPEIELRVANILNRSYRNYLNRYRYFAHEAGRSFQLSLFVPLKSITHEHDTLMPILD